MSRYIPVALRREIRKADRGCCAYCHTPEELTVTNFEFDHIIPETLGGKTVFENLCLACPTCNGQKWAHEFGVDPKTGIQTRFFHPRTQVWEEHFVWSQDKEQIIGLTSEGRATVETFTINRVQLVRLRRLWIKLGIILD